MAGIRTIDGTDSGGYDPGPVASADYNPSPAPKSSAGPYASQPLYGQSPVSSAGPYASQPYLNPGYGTPGAVPGQINGVQYSGPALYQGNNPGTAGYLNSAYQAAGGTLQQGSTLPTGGVPSLSGRSMDDATILAYVNQWAQDPTADPSLKNDPNYWVQRIKETGGLGSDNADYWMKASTGPTAFFRNPGREWTPAAAQPQTPAGTGVFDDPATKQFETLLNQRIQQLMGPAYTPSQLDLMQTQQFDPLMAERDANRQRIIQWGASHGMSPNDGPVQQMLQQSDLGFEQLGTKAHANVAQQAIGQQQSNQNQAVSLAGVIPNLAWSRLMGANGTIQQTNPMSALQLLNNFQQQGYGQGADFASGLMQVLPYLMQLFPSGA